MATTTTRTRRISASTNGSRPAVKAGNSKVHAPATEEEVKRIWKLIKDNGVQIIDL